MRMIPKIILVLLIFYGFNSCNTTGPVNDKNVILSLEEVSCKEAWLKLSISGVSLPVNVELYKNNSINQTINLTTSDTILYVDSLLPSQSYSFHSIIQPNNQSQITSNQLQVKSLDSTSNNFSWQTWTFGGQAGSCALYDVAIVNDTCIYAVGEIYLLDSLGQPDPNAYNFVHWNGSEWKLSRLYFYTFCGQPDKGSYPTRSIIAFNKNDIWVTSGSQITHYNGLNQISTECITVSVNKLWGTDDDNLYAVGVGGKIAHYHNGQWSRIESGTTSIINDIWGIINKQDNTVLYCPVSSFFVPGDKKILKITDGIVDSVQWNRDVRLYSAWSPDDNILYVCGEGAYVNKFGVWEQIKLPEVGTNSIRGNNVNDIFIVGDYGFKAHFNGIHWQDFSTNHDKGYSKVAFKANIAAICGNFNGKALVEIGTRN